MQQSTNLFKKFEKKLIDFDSKENVIKYLYIR